jgi:hypothetical protein
MPFSASTLHATDLRIRRTTARELRGLIKKVRSGRVRFAHADRAEDLAHLQLQLSLAELLEGDRPGKR